MLVRHALRSLRNSPGYTAACVAVLALGIGANAAIFSLIYDAVFKPLPYPDSERLVLLYSGFKSLPEPAASHMPVTRHSYEEWRRQATSSFDAVGAFHETPYRESGVEEPRVVGGALVSTNLLTLLGARTQAGRLFHADEETPGRDRVVVLSDRYFQRRFKGDRSAIGQTITLGGTAYTVIGAIEDGFIMPSTMDGDSKGRVDVYVPLSRGWTRPEIDASSILTVAGRLRPGVTIDQARAEMRTIGARLHQESLDRFPVAEINLFSFRSERQSSDLNQALYLLFGAVGLVLLTGCANLANLTLARTTRRTREVAVRRALGASRVDIVLQLLTESMLLAVTGAVAGLVIAHWMISALLALAPSDVVLPGMGALSIPVFLFAAAVAAITVLLFGLAPAVSVSGTDLNGALKTGDRGGSAAGHRSRRFLIAAEVAMALVLVTGAGLMLRSFANVIHTDLGFNTHLLAIDVDLPEREYPDRAARERLIQRIVDDARAMPGVTGAAAGDALPLHRVSMTSFEVAGQAPLPKGEFTTADVANVLPGYLEILGVPTMVGRALTADDVARNRGTGEGVVIVNRAFADKHLASLDPLQQRLVFDGRAFQIVGVVANFRALGAEMDIRPQFFRPGLDNEAPILLLRSPTAVDVLTADVRSMLGAVDERLSTSRVRTMEEYVNQWLEIRWFALVLIGAFASLALVLAMIGVYSVLANLVAARTREIGIRMALGATPAGICTLMAAQSLRPVLFGLLAGAVASAVFGRLIESALFQVTPQDPLTFGLSMAAILAVTPLAIWWPIRRASRIECTVALREE